MSRLVEEELVIPAPTGGDDILSSVARSVGSQISANAVPLRFAVTASDADAYHCEIGALSESDHHVGDSIFRFVPRTVEHTDTFNAVLVVPTGIGANIGGHAGDAGPVAALLASVCDTLVTHPNVVNASDIMELPANAMYVEGSVLTSLLMGTVGLQKARNNRLLVVIDGQTEKIFTDAAINSVNAARSSYGLICDKIVQLDTPLSMHSRYAPSGRAVGEVGGLDDLLAVLTENEGTYDAVAVSSVIGVPYSYHSDYYADGGGMVNPWGGVEAMLTHALSMLYRVPSAHSPMLESQDVLDIDVGVVDPRMAAEVISIGFLQCILKGMQRSPRIITDATAMQHPDIFGVSDVSCLVIPDGCIGLPTLAALEQGIPVIAVRGNTNLMRNDLSALPWRRGQLHFVDNYLEAAGLMAALKAGIDPRAVRRPLLAATVESADRRSAEPEAPGMIDGIAERLSPF